MMKTISEVAQLCLETIANWEVLTACSGSEACLGFAEQPDAILLDVMMPEMDGLATFKSYRLLTSPLSC